MAGLAYAMRSIPLGTAYAVWAASARWVQGPQLTVHESVVTHAIHDHARVNVETEQGTTFRRLPNRPVGDLSQSWFASVSAPGPP
jgi:hypothetical protein